MLPSLVVSMDGAVCTALRTLTDALDSHPMELIEDDGSLFLDRELVDFYKVKRDLTKEKGKQVYLSRQKSVSGMDLSDVSFGGLDFSAPARPQDWPTLLRLMQGWGWSGNTLFFGNGSNGTTHDKVFFERVVACAFSRKHRNRNLCSDREVALHCFVALVIMPFTLVSCKCPSTV